jgi:hypothetical protein
MTVFVEFSDDIALSHEGNRTIIGPTSLSTWREK